MRSLVLAVSLAAVFPFFRTARRRVIAHRRLYFTSRGVSHAADTFASEVFVPLQGSSPVAFQFRQCNKRVSLLVHARHWVGFFWLLVVWVFCLGGLGVGFVGGGLGGGWCGFFPDYSE